MLKKIFSALAVMIFIFSVSQKISAAEVVTVTGSASGPKNAIVGSNFYKTFARQAAKIDALCQLVEVTQGVQFDSKSTVDDEGNLKSDFVKVETKFDENFWNKHFSKIEVTKVKFLDEGCEVTIKAILK